MWRSSDERFSYVGAITLFWNDIEHHLDDFLCHSLLVPRELWDIVAVRISGFDGKTYIVRSKLRRDLGEKDQLYHAISQTFSAAEKLKQHRDHIVHTAEAFELDLGTTRQRRETKTMPMTADYLKLLATHMDAMVEELMLVGDVFLILYGATSDDDWPRPDARDPDKLSLKQPLREARERIQAQGQVRQAFAQLPKLPGPRPAFGGSG
jgi:hypothetical protein